MYTASNADKTESKGCWYVTVLTKHAGTSIAFENCTQESLKFVIGKIWPNL